MVKPWGGSHPNSVASERMSSPILFTKFPGKPSFVVIS